MSDADKKAGRPPRGGSGVDIALSRRSILLGGGILGTGAIAGAFEHHDGMLGGPSESLKGSLPYMDGVTDVPRDGTSPDLRFLTAAEKAFVVAAADRIIPADASGPSASEADVPVFIDRQLASSFGQGQHLYTGGPWPNGLPQQGYQSRFTPAALYRYIIPVIEARVARAYGGKSFASVGPDVQTEILKEMEAGQFSDDPYNAKAFFVMFLQNVKEGYFADPIYGGNKDMAAWRMIGFPGAHYDYSDWVSRHGERVPFPPVSLRGRPGWDA
ncbi:gluconate 2-dehydrogenase subunit 3 family protein [Sphingomonas sp. NFX23]|uniref:gluconate 2-dehydrogenase subunit 3 family protein n=1 Tax=Sphingomonas sp. NFX23 TaxID=2819532 RepID=UPI003CEA5B3C